jgi:hypothetical protein
MKIRPVVLLLVFLATITAAAQQQSTSNHTGLGMKPVFATIEKAVAEIEPKSQMASSLASEVAEPPAPASLLDSEDDPLARYHFFHNERVHRLRQRAWRNVFADPVYLFHYWYTSRKGMTLLHFRRGRVRVGFETQRVQLPGDSRGYATPARAMDACHAFPSYHGGVCRPLYYHEGERRYSVTLRLRFGR